MGRGATLLLVLGFVVASNGYADENLELAKQHFAKGKRLYDVGRFAEAATEYEAAYQAKDDPALLFNLGQAYRLAGSYDKAILAYKAFLRNTPDASNRTEVENRIAESQSLLEQQRAEQALEHRSAKPHVERKKDPTLAPTGTLQSTTSPRTSPRKPVWKRWWPWTVGAVVIAGAAAGIAIGVTQSHASERVLPPVMANQ